MKSDQSKDHQQSDSTEQPHPWQELRLRGDLRRDLGITSTLLSRKGKTLQTDLTAIRQLAESLNSRHQDNQPATAGAINALGLLDELKRQLFIHYLDKVDSEFLTNLQEELTGEFSRQELIKVLTSFTESFPPLSMLEKKEGPSTWLLQQSSGASNLQMAIEELLLLRLNNDNPACGTLRELIDDSDLRRDTKYDDVIHSLELFIRSRPPLKNGDENLLEMLLAPSVESPESLSGQLKYISENWEFIYEWMTGQ